jgi:hypothetical protein
MAAWGDKDGSDDITMIADGNGQFADAVGLGMDKQSSEWASAASAIRWLSTTVSSSRLNVEGTGRVPGVERRTHARATVTRWIEVTPVAGWSLLTEAPKRPSPRRVGKPSEINEEIRKWQGSQSARPEQQQSRKAATSTPTAGWTPPGTTRSQPQQQRQARRARVAAGVYLWSHRNQVSNQISKISRTASEMGGAKPAEKASEWTEQMRSDGSSRDLAMTDGPNESAAIEASRRTQSQNRAPKTPQMAS